MPERAASSRQWRRYRHGKARVATPPKWTRARGGVMADSKTNELRQRRSALSESLPTLGRKRDQSYRLNSDALALDRAGVTHHAPEELARLGEGQAAAEAAIRDAQC